MADDQPKPLYPPELLTLVPDRIGNIDTSLFHLDPLSEQLLELSDGLKPIGQLIMETGGEELAVLHRLKALRDAGLISVPTKQQKKRLTLTIEDHTSADGISRYPTGGNEPVLTLDGERIVDSKGRVSRVTSAGAGPSVGKYLLLAYLPPEHAIEGTDLQIMYMNELYPVKVAVAGSTPLFDPENQRMKG